MSKRLRLSTLILLFSLVSLFSPALAQDTFLTVTDLLGASYVRPLTDCPTAGITYTRSTNSFGCVSGASAPAGGSNTQVQFNDNGVLNGDAGLTYVKATDTLTVGSLVITIPLAPTSGGTGLALFAVGDVLYANTTTSLARRAAVAVGSVIASAGVNTPAVWSSSPTLTTSLTTPLVIGGTAVDSTLTLESTAGVGTTDAILFKTGSQVTAASFLTTGQFQLGSTAAQSNALLSARKTGTGLEFGHTNPAGFGSSLGGEAGTGAPFLCLSCIAGTTNNTYQTLGKVGVILKTDNSGALLFGQAQTATADNQVFTELMRLTSTGLGIGKTPAFKLDATVSSTDPAAIQIVAQFANTTTLTANNANIIEGTSTVASVNQGAFNHTATGGIRAMESTARATGASGTIADIIAFRGIVNNLGAGILTLGTAFQATGANTGAGTYTTYVGFDVLSAPPGASNYGVRSSIGASANNWNFYSGAAAQNYFLGNVGIGSGKTLPAVALDITGSIALTSTILSAGVAFASLGTPANGAIVYCTNCDQPTLVATTCTSAGGQTGAIAVRLNGAWKCLA